MTGRPRVTIVGLGPAGPDQLTPETLAVLDGASPVILRTRRHPAADALGAAESCDDLYESADTFDDVYDAVVERVVVAATESGHAVYAVPGSPLVLERSVERLRHDERVEVTLVPAMSFLDVAWARLGIDPVEAGVRLVDGHLFATAAAGERGPLLVAHCHNQRVLSDIKLAVDEPGDEPVVVLQGLGTADERILEVAWADLDREVEADHLTSIYIRSLASPVGTELLRFQDLVATLRRECPWDREQTHRSLRRHLIEEAYEVLEAIDAFDPETGQGADDLEEELGDLLFQVFLHSVLAAEEGWFELADVARSVHDKLYDRHPHVFGGEQVDGTDELIVSWEARKVIEKGRASVLDGVPAALPALSLAEKTVKKAGAIGAPVPESLTAALADRLAAVAERPGDDTVGAALMSLVAHARGAGVDPEMALREAVKQAADEVRAFEARAGD
ncbi:MAG: MazG nucleotide pyrophosphohydrolase domain-containing protein [Actinomycetota bacterium]